MGVTEAMWKASRRRQRRRRSPGADPAPAQRAAGHRPCRRGAFGDAIVEFLGDPPLAARLGQTAREQVRGLFLNDRHFVRWVEVFGSVFGPRAAAARPAGPVAGRASASIARCRVRPCRSRRLTGLWNRRRFETELGHARQNAERLALLPIDVDRYNEVIRRQGAVAAQGLIQSIAQVLGQRLRPNDTLARMGGDELTTMVRHAPPARPEPGRRALHGRARAATRRRHQPDSRHHQHRRRVLRPGDRGCRGGRGRDRHRYDDCFGDKLRAGAASPDGQGDGRGGHYALRHVRDVTSGRNAHGSGGR
jgi:GGDEF domain-containing protein